MGQGKVISALIGASNKARFPGVQGSQLSVNMFYAKNGADEFMESVPGMKLKNAVLILFSMLFYCFSRPDYVPLLVALVLLNYYIPKILRNKKLDPLLKKEKEQA